MDLAHPKSLETCTLHRPLVNSVTTVPPPPPPPAARPPANRNAALEASPAPQPPPPAACPSPPFPRLAAPSIRRSHGDGGPDGDPHAADDLSHNDRALLGSGNPALGRLPPPLHHHTADAFLPPSRSQNARLAAARVGLATPSRTRRPTHHLIPAGVGKSNPEGRQSEAEGDLEAAWLPGVENMGCAGDADSSLDHGVGDAAGDGGEGGPAGVGSREVWVDGRRRQRSGSGGAREDRAAGSEFRGRRRAVVPESARARRDDGSAARVFVPDVCECRGGHHLSIYLSTRRVSSLTPRSCNPSNTLWRPATSASSQTS